MGSWGHGLLGSDLGSWGQTWGAVQEFPVEIHKSLPSNGLRISSLIKVVSLLARTYGKKDEFLDSLLVRGRRPHWSFRGLLNVHLRYGLSARCIAKATHLSRRLRRFRYLHRRPDSYRLERPSCRVGIAPTEDQHLFTAHTRPTIPRWDTNRLIAL